jgi:hypothetical protein
MPAARGQQCWRPGQLLDDRGAAPVAHRRAGGLGLSHFSSAGGRGLLPARSPRFGGGRLLLDLVASVLVVAAPTPLPAVNARAALLIPSAGVRTTGSGPADRVQKPRSARLSPTSMNQRPNNNEKSSFYRYTEQVSARHLDPGRRALPTAPGSRRLDGKGSPSVDEPISVKRAHSSVLGGSLPPIIPSENNTGTGIAEWRT